MNLDHKPVSGYRVIFVATAGWTLGIIISLIWNNAGSDQQTVRWLSHGLLWAAGLAMFGAGAWQMRRRRSARTTTLEAAQAAHQAEITRRQQVEDELSASKARLELALEGSNAAIWHLGFAPGDPITSPAEVYLSPRKKAFLGYGPDEMPNTLEAWLDRIIPEDLPLVLNSLRQGAEGTPPTAGGGIEYRARHKDGTIRWLYTHGTLQRFSEGIPIRWSGVTWDITERKQADQDLAEERTLLRTLIDMMPDYIYYKDADGRLVFANKQLVGTLNTLADGGEIIGKTDAELYPEDLAARYYADDQVVLSGAPVINRAEEGFTPTGERIQTLTTKVPVRDSQGKVIGLVGIGRDVTALKRAEQALQHAYNELEDRVAERTAELTAANQRLQQEITERQQIEAALRESETNLSTVINNAQDAIISIDRDYRLIIVNAAAREISQTHLGITLEPDMCILDVLPEHLKASWRERYDRALSGERFSTQDSFITGSVTTPADKAGRCEYISFNPITRDDGTVTGVVVFSRDITQRMQVEAAEREQRAFAEALAATTAVLNSTLDLDTVLEHILANVGRVVPHDAANIMFIEEGSARIVGVSEHYVELGLAEELMAIRFKLDETPNLQEMAQTGKPCVVTDSETYNSWVDISVTSWIRSYTGAPIQREGQVVGFLNLDSASPSAFDSQDAERLQAFADQAAVAIHNARLFETQRKRSQIAEILRQASTVINSTLSLNEVMALILQQLRTVIAYNSASIQRFQNGILTIVACEGFEKPDKVMGLTFELSTKHPNYRVVATKAPLAHEDIRAVYAVFQDEADYFQSGHIRGWLGVPLISKDRVIGIIALDWTTPHKHTSEEIELATAFANQAAAAMENAHLYQQLETYTESLQQAVETRTAELRDAKEHVEAILENSPDAILLLRTDGTIEQVNYAFVQLLGYSRENAYQRKVIDMAVPAHTSRFAEALRAVLDTGRTTELEVILRRKDQSAFCAGVAIGPLRERSTVTNLVCSLRDITAIKEAERIKDTFVSNVSHELRTPVSSLKLYHDLLVRNPTKQDAYMVHLRRETKRLERIIEDLLNLSRIDQGQVTLNRQAVNLNSLANQYVTDRATLAESQQLTLTCGCLKDLPLVQADAGLIGQALSILLTNALTYTPPGGEVTVSTRTETKEGRLWAGVTVSDNGLGIPPDERPSLFKRFFRGRVGIESGAPGTGLGLALVKEIIDQHQGRVEVESTGVPGEGVAFTIWLPVIKD